MKSIIENFLTSSPIIPVVVIDDVKHAVPLANALLEGGIALHQLWLFWIAPILGGIAGALLYNLVSKPDVVETDDED